MRQVKNKHEQCMNIWMTFLAIELNIMLLDLEHIDYGIQLDFAE